MTHIKSLEKSKKEILGKKLGTFFFYGYGSLHQYRGGWIIKPIKQDPIVITIKQGYLLARWMRNKNELLTMKESVNKYSRIVANKI